MKLEENVYDEFNNIINNIPQNISPLEKVRWVYIKLGELFCYDYYLDYGTEVDFSSNYINRYQTCVQVSNILNYVLNKIDGVKSEVYERRLTRRGIYEQNHIANLVTLSSGEKFILDLTLDLFLIQGGFRTSEFGYSSNADASVDMFTLKECEEMDRKLGLIKNGEYTNNKMNKVYSEIRDSFALNRGFEEQTDYIMNSINENMPPYRSLQEAKNYVNRCFVNTIRCNLYEYNLRSEKRMVTCFCFRNMYKEEVWYLFDEERGFIKTSPDEVYGMLNDGWYTKSNTLFDLLDEKQNKIKM